jgi:hypothetical protein
MDRDAWRRASLSSESRDLTRLQKLDELRERPQNYDSRLPSSLKETELTGKEGNKLQERATGEVTDPDEYRNSYGRRSESWALVLSVLHEIGVPDIVALTGRSRSAVYEVLRGTTPRLDHARAYEQAAVSFARQRLHRWRVEAPDGSTATLSCYITERGRRGEGMRRCTWCGAPLRADARTDAFYCSPAHRASAARQRRRKR